MLPATGYNQFFVSPVKKVKMALRAFWHSTVDMVLKSEGQKLTGSTAILPGEPGSASSTWTFPLHTGNTNPSCSSQTREGPAVKAEPLIEDQSL